MQEKVGDSVAEVSSLTKMEVAIIKTLLYFDIFNYPLKSEEIFYFAGAKALHVGEIHGALEHLVGENLIYCFGEFFSTQNKIENVERRRSGNAVAESIMPKAYQRALLIGKFPFVRSVMASGSLSKGYMDSKSDLDFFIVTAPGRLYIARMLLVLYKRIFLHNSSKEFCVNYFISSDQLEIEEKNQFTATELATVIPMFGQHLYKKMLETNTWLYNFFPNYLPRPSTPLQETSGLLKTLAEKLMNGALGQRLDEWCMRVTQKRWEKLYRKQYSDPDFDVAFKSKRHASKTHPRHYQKHVTNLMDEKWKWFAERHNCEMA